MTEKLLHKFQTIDDNIKRLNENIAKAALNAGRKENEVSLMAVTKTVPPEEINQAIACGISLIGENRVQELLTKIKHLNLENVQIHLIGHLQTNKVKKVAGEVELIQSVDSIKLAREINKFCQKNSLHQKILLEVNIGEEESKKGFLSHELDEVIHEIATLSHISVEGLMTIPPFCEKSSEIRSYFSNMRKVFIDIDEKKLDNVSMSVLSMGMSGDYEEAIMEGATMIRVGSGIFGARN